MDMDDLPEAWKDAAIAWAQRTDAVSELWLFGSRGPKGGATATSDVDLALVLMPKVGSHDWALGNYGALKETWRAELEQIVDTTRQPRGDSARDGRRSRSPVCGQTPLGAVLMTWLPA
jgi:hypothetical protein